MKEKVFSILRIVFNILKNVVVVLSLVWILLSLNGINKQLSTIEKQNNNVYLADSQLFSKIILQLNILRQNEQTILEINARNHKDLSEYITFLEEQIKAIEQKAIAEAEISFTRDNMITTYIQENTEKPSYDFMKASIVYLIEAQVASDMGSIGTGVVIKVTENETYILTNKHVFSFDEGTISYVFQDNEKYLVTLVNRDDLDHDMQIVKTNKVLPGKIAVKGIKDVMPQDKVFMVGNNNGNPFMYSEGTVSGFMKITGNLLVGMPSGPGNSGSAIFTQDGYIAGLLYAGQVFPVNDTISLDTAHGIAINSHELRLYLADYFIE